MRDLDAEIERLEQEAQYARKAIRKTVRQRKALEREIMRLIAKEQRTREQHLARPNRLLADLLDLKRELGEL